MKQESTLTCARLKTPRAAAIAGILFAFLLITGLVMFRLSVRADPLEAGAVEVSVNVVGGADPQRVVELLKSTAAAHPGVTKEPSPQVYVTNFSAGAVTFQLRAWTDRHENLAQLRSDLSVALNDALAHEKIAIA
jgi:small-conductance mechanosensitive channel